MQLISFYRAKKCNASFPTSKKCLASILSEVDPFWRTTDKSIFEFDALLTVFSDERLRPWPSHWISDLDHSKKNCNGCANKAFRSAFVPYDGPCVHHNVFARVQTTSATYHEVWRGSGNLLSGFVLMKHLSIGDLMTVRCIPNNVWQSILSVESNLLALNDDLMWNITVEKSW